MQDRKGHIQLRLPSFLDALPAAWAVENNWFATMNPRKGVLDRPQPHLSFAVSSMIAGLKLMRRDERQRIMLRGAKHILAQEEALDIPGQKRVRLLRTDTIRPAAASKA